MPTGLTSLKIFYNDNGNKTSKNVYFKGNFGFEINGKKYKATSNGIVDKNGKEVQGLRMSKEEAYQFIGMSNTAELAKDYTFTQKDINAAKEDFSSYNKDNTKANSIMGSVVTKGVSNGYANYSNGIYSTHYGSNISIWQE